MILVTITFDYDKTARISNEELALEHYWEPYAIRNSTHASG